MAPSKKKSCNFTLGYGAGLVYGFEFVALTIIVSKSYFCRGQSGVFFSVTASAVILCERVL